MANQKQNELTEVQQDAVRRQLDAVQCLTSLERRLEGVEYAMQSQQRQYEEAISDERRTTVECYEARELRLRA